MKFLLLTLFVTLLFGQLGGLPIADGVTIYIHDIVATSIIILFLLRSNSIKNIFKADLIWPILGFEVAAVLSLAVASWSTSGMEILKGSLYLWRFILYAGIYFAVLYCPFQARLLTQLTYATGIGFAILGFIQYFLYPNLRNLVYLGWDPHYYRLVSTFLDPNFAGIFLVLTFTLGLSFSVKNKNRIFFMISQITILAAIFLTYSRSSLVALVVAIAIWCLIFKKWKMAILAGLFIALGIYMLPMHGVEILSLMRRETALARIGNWQESITKWKESPWVGLGFNTLRYILGREQNSKAGAGIDNSLLFVLLTTGVVGLGAYLWLLLKIVRKCFYVLRSSQNGFGVGVLASWLAVLAHSFFNNSLFYPWVMIWLWIITGAFEKMIKEKAVTSDS